MDLSNEIPSFDVVVGAFHLGCAFSFYPKGTIHLAIVDPGVGGPRRPVLVRTKDYYFVGPDNGLFSLVARRDPVRAVYELNETRFFRSEMSSTFHGRDLFGPVAAHLSRGIKPAAFGPRRTSIRVLPDFSPSKKGRGWVGRILFFDKFGNAFSNLHETSVGTMPGRRVYWRGRRIPLYRTYADMPHGRPGAIFGSSGFLELALREDSFEGRLRSRRGEIIRLLAAS